MDVVLEQIATDHRFANLTQIWLYGDHYKWRAMRANGVSEEYVTGKAEPKEKRTLVATAYWRCG